MTKEQMIEELANLIYDNRPIPQISIEDATEIATVLCAVGYRKVPEGEWIYIKNDGGIYCSECGNLACSDECEYHLGRHCPYCGARMKGGK